MENKLEQLLNSLIEKGWKPRGRKKTLHITIYDCDLNVYLDGGYLNEDKKSFRELVSKESNLWQFVCENGMINNVGNFVFRRLKDGKKFGFDKPITHFTFRLIESSLKDESELEDFILDNVKIGNI